MFTSYCIVVIAPVAGLAVYCLAHSVACWLVAARRNAAAGGAEPASGRSPYFPLMAGFFVGLLAVAALSFMALLAMQAPLIDLLAQMALNLLSYLALAFGYFNFINMNVASLRIRMLEELLESGGSMTKQQLFGCYNTERVIALRIARLVSGGHLILREGRYYRGKAKFLLVARIFDLLRAMILGCRRRERPTASNPLNPEP
jgi:hypothetical protein